MDYCTVGVGLHSTDVSHARLAKLSAENSSVLLSDSGKSIYRGLAICEYDMIWHDIGDGVSTDRGRGRGGSRIFLSIEF